MSEKQKKVWKANLKTVWGNDADNAFRVVVVDNQEGEVDSVELVLGGKSLTTALKKEDKKVAVIAILKEISTLAAQAAVFIEALKVEEKK